MGERNSFLLEGGERINFVDEECKKRETQLVINMLVEIETMFSSKHVKRKERGCCSSSLAQRYHRLLVKTMSFLAHFFIVMLLLFFGAMIFAHIEDPEIGDHRAKEENDTYQLHCERFSAELRLHYNINLSNRMRYPLLREMKAYIQMEEKRNGDIEHQKHIHNRRYIFVKWFYFVTIATTTIGYGDVCPKTDAGKIFYCGFSIIGILLMMSLLKSCGAIMTGFNKHVYRSINRCLCRNEGFVSEELLSLISITFIFLCFLFLGIWHGKTMNTEHWTLVDVVYFWIVTFTTVGFGDVVHPLDEETEHIWDLLIYRIFGLSILAGIIDSLSAYIKLRKDILRKDTIVSFLRRKGFLEHDVKLLRQSIELRASKRCQQMLRRSALKYKPSRR